MNNTNNDVTGFVVKNSSSLTVNAGSQIDFSNGSGNTGISVASGSFAQNSGNITIASGTGISVTGQNSLAENKGDITIDNGTGLLITDKAVASGIGNITVYDGVAGVHLSDGGILNVGQGTHSITTGGTAHGIFLDTGATGILVANTAIDILGTGHGIENTAETNAITLRGMTIDVTDGSGIRTAVTIDPNSKATVNVDGAGIGFNFVQADLTTLTTGDLKLGPNYTFNVNGAGGTGIAALTTGRVETSGTVNVTDHNGGPALLAGTASHTLNLGTLKSDSFGPVVELNNGSSGTSFVNMGTILAASAMEIAINGGTQNEAIYMLGGKIRGEVTSGDGDDSLEFTGGTLDGSITMGDGRNKALISGVSLNNTSHVTSGNSGANSLILRDLSARGSSMANDDPLLGVNLGDGWNNIALNNSRFTLSGNIKLDDTVSKAELFIGQGSTLFAGNNVDAVIGYKSGNNQLTVTNYGLIDLTTSKNKGPMNSPQFMDTLNIAGNYDGRSGNLLMDTYLNMGGALANQATDRLLIHGDASGGTFIDFYLTHAPGLDAGSGTDLNGDGLIQSNEGISIVQVAGNANPNSFQLKNGYVASGAFAYNLYSFDHATADTSQNVVNGLGNQFYDFRLANAFAAPLNRPQVVPQVPSYLSQPMANAIYGNMVIDDLHKRMGELRYRKGEASAAGDSDGDNEERGRRSFLRFIGGDYDYNSSVSASRFGFDFDLKIQAVQFGFNLLDLVNENNDGLQAGIAWTHGKSTLTPDAKHDGYSRSKTNADTIGLYATYQREKNLYFDGVLAGTWSRSKVDTKAYERANTMKTFGWSASIESGYSFFPTENFKLEPQAQLTYFHETTKDSTDADGSRIKYEDNDQLIGRFGLRAAYEHQKESGLKVTPYAVANYYTDFGSSVPKVNISSGLPGSPGYNFKTGSYGDSIEGGLGITLDAPNGVSVYTEVDYRKGVNGNGLEGWRGDVGIKLSF